MANSRMITLLTDFGLQDVYVGVMKGAISLINSQLQIIDLTHQIPPQDITAASFALLNAYPFFPSNILITNISESKLKSKSAFVAIKQQKIPYCRTYSDVPQGNLLALVGSHGLLEIAVNNGNAKNRLQAKVEDEVYFMIREMY